MVQRHDFLNNLFYQLKTYFMNELIELTTEEKLSNGGGYFLGPIFFNLIEFVNEVRSGFAAGLSDSIKKT
jgi:hypothetical protein